MDKRHAQEVTLQPKEGAMQLWTEIVKGLELAGYDRAGGEYLKLSQMLLDSRKRELLESPGGSDPSWAQLQALGAQALSLLDPLVTAAGLLADLPIEGSSPLPAERTKAGTATSRPNRQSGAPPARSEKAKPERRRKTAAVRRPVRTVRGATDANGKCRHEKET